MTEQNPAPPSDNGASAPTSDKVDSPMIPKARLDEELGKRRALEEELAHIASVVLSAVPENLKPLIPTELSPAQQAAYWIRVRDAGVLTPNPVVPETDNRKPTVTPREIDISTLPVYARMASGYNSLKG